MLKVMLVDDEPFITQGLKVLCDWEKEGYTIVKTASNGIEAYDYIRENAVDVVIADIKMPGMTGLELLEKVREEKISDAYFVILSGFNDFDYVRTAMRFGCMDYLLKPVDKNELVTILRKIAAENQESAALEEYHQKTETAFVHRHLIALVVGRYDDVNLDYVTNNMSLSDGIRYVIIELPDMDDTDVEEGSLMQYRRELNETAERLLGKDGNHLIYDVSLNHGSYDTGFIYADYMAEAEGKTDIQYLESLQKKLEQSMEKKVRILAGKKVGNIAAVSKSYSTACILKSQEVFREPKPVIIYEKELSVNPGNAKLCKQSVDRLIQSIEQGDQVQIYKCVNEFYDDISAAGLGDSVSLNMNYLLFQLIHIATELDNELDQEEILQKISESTFDEGIRRGSSKHMYHFACEYAEYLSQLRKNVSHSILRKVEAEVKEHYDENLSLSKMSEKFFINSSYLGLLFHKKYGVSFKDYLADYRINEAAKLLINTDERIVDISSKVGYKNSDYFVRKFIEIKGVTPSQFRRQNR